VNGEQGHGLVAAVGACCLYNSPGGCYSLAYILALSITAPCKLLSKQQEGRELAGSRATARTNSWPQGSGPVRPPDNTTGACREQGSPARGRERAVVDGHGAAQHSGQRACRQAIHLDGVVVVAHKQAQLQGWGKEEGSRSSGGGRRCRCCTTEWCSCTRPSRQQSDHPPGRQQPLAADALKHLPAG